MKDFKLLLINEATDLLEKYPPQLLENKVFSDDVILEDIVNFVHDNKSNFYDILNKTKNDEIETDIEIFEETEFFYINDFFVTKTYNDVNVYYLHRILK